VPNLFVNDSSKISNLFTMWKMVEELKKTMETTVESERTSGIAREWPEEADIDSGQLFNFVQNAHPWLTESGAVQQDDLHITIPQTELTKIARDPIKQSLSLAVSLSKARLLTQDHRDRIDRLILSGQSCNMQCVQVVANEVFRESEGVFDYDPANVRFDRDSAKTSVSLGACVGRYLESVRIDPFNEKTKQMLRDGYDQIELVIENLFTYLSCRLAYDSLVAMVTIFDQGHELNLRSYTDRRPVARTSIHNLRPVQEKFWIYRIDFEGAEPQYLGLINAEAVALENGFDDFRKFREEYLVGFEADAELFVRAFFLPRGQKTITAKTYEDPVEGGPLPELIARVDGSAMAPSTSYTDHEDYEEPEDHEDYEEPEDHEDHEDEDHEDHEIPEDVENEFDEDAENEFNEDAEEHEEPEQEQEEVAKVAAPSMADRQREEKRKLEEQRAKDNKAPELIITHTITSQEIFDRRPVISANTPLEYIVQYPNGEEFKCALSEPLPIRESYEYHVESPDETDFSGTVDETDPSRVLKFQIDEEETDEATLVCDERGRMVMLTCSPYEIKIWADIEYVPQKMDIHYDPFCGHH
ncbi:MAG TPA: hypothetical protein PLR86_06780, partial [Planctomycetota bacterium]|nr:hypothetical protein [Planctomycetota bacterium]